MEWSPEEMRKRREDCQKIIREEGIEWERINGERLIRAEESTLLSLRARLSPDYRAAQARRLREIEGWSDIDRAHEIADLMCPEGEEQDVEPVDKLDLCIAVARQLTVTEGEEALSKLY